MDLDIEKGSYVNTKLYTIAVDFDGVIHTYDKGWHDGTIYGHPLPGSIEGLRALMARFAVYVHTSRDPRQVAAWLNKMGVVAITLPDVEMPYFWSTPGAVLVTNRKLAAVAYIDDRGFQFHNWDEVMDAFANVDDWSKVPNQYSQFQPKYPYEEGDVIVLGPETIMDKEGIVISHKGRNYYPDFHGEEVGGEVTNTPYPLDENLRVIEGDVQVADLSLDPHPNAFGETVHLIHDHVGEEDD